MQSFSWQYPGDQVDVCVQMTRAEFLQQYPRTPIKVISGGDVVEEIPVGEDEVVCDFCSEDPLDEIYLIHRGNKAVCKQCADHTILPHKIVG